MSMYVCGVTAYDYNHIGHARVYVAFDVLYRWGQPLFLFDNIFPLYNDFVGITISFRTDPYDNRTNLATIISSFSRSSCIFYD